MHENFQILPHDTNIGQNLQIFAQRAFFAQKMDFNFINFSALDHIGTAIKDPEKYDEKVTESEEVDPIEPVKKSTTVFLNFSKKATPRFTNMNIPVTQMPTAQVKPNKIESL